MEAMSLETMDYQMESPLIPPSVNFNGPSSPPPPPRQCPYAFQQQQPQQPQSNYTNTPHFRDQYFPPTVAVPLMPRSTVFNQHPIIWTNSNYPLLPPPTPSSHINNPPNYSHTTMSENIAQRSGQSRPQANTYETEPTTNQSDDSENEIHSEDGSDFGTVPTWNVDSNDRRVELPPMMSSYERTVTSSIQNISLAEGSTSTSAHILPPTLPRNDPSAASGNRQYGGGPSRSRPPPAGMSGLHYSAWVGEQEREMIARRENLLRRQRIVSDEAVMNSIRNDPLVESYLNEQVPPLENEENMGMDDPARVEHANRRYRALQNFVIGRHMSKKTGASKSALESLVKVPVQDLKEDDRTCPICYNDYGIENPEGEVEFPLQLPKCKHHFGQICLKKWLDDKSTCPYCRDQLPSESLRSRRTAERQRREMILARAASTASTLASSSMTRRTGATADEALGADAASRLRMAQFEVNMIGSGVDRQEPALPMHPAYHGLNSRSPPRRSRGRGGSNGRVPMQADFGFNNMRTPANPNEQQALMRIPVGPALDPFASDLSRGGMLAQPAHFPSIPAQYDTPPQFPGSSSFSGFNPYAENYAPPSNPSYLSVPTQHRDFRPYPRDPYSSHPDFSTHGYGPGPSSDPFLQSRNNNPNIWPSDYPAPAQRSNRNSTAEGMHAAEAAGERRILMSLDRDSQNTFSGQPHRDGNAEEVMRYHHENQGSSFDHPPQPPPGNPRAPPYPRTHHRERSYPPGAPSYLGAAYPSVADGWR